MISVDKNSVYAELVTVQEEEQADWDAISGTKINFKTDNIGFKTGNKLVSKIDPFGDNSIMHKYEFDNGYVDTTSNSDLVPQGDIAIVDTKWGKGVTCTTPDTSPTSDYCNLDMNVFNQDQFTISCSFVLNAYSPGYNQSLFNNYDCTDTQVLISLYLAKPNDDLAYFRYIDRSVSSDGGTIVIGKKLLLNKKYTFVGMVDKINNTISAYLNGVYMGSATGSNISGNSSQTVRLFGWESNCDSGSTIISANATVLQLEMYDRLLNIDEIKNLSTQTASDNSALMKLQPLGLPLQVTDNDDILTISENNNNVAKNKVNSLIKDVLYGEKTGTLVASNAQDNDRYGFISLTYDGLVMTVGARDVDDGGDNVGKIYEYQRNSIDSVWNEVRQFTSSTAEVGGKFGARTALSNDGLVLAVSAYQEDTPVSNAGRVYTYKRATRNDDWTEISILNASDPHEDDYYGIGLSISDNGLVMAVGSHRSDTAGTDAGKVYTYKRTSIDADWVEVSQLTASDAEADAYFGIDLDLSNNGLVMAVGEMSSDTAASGAGKVYEYHRDTIDASWTEINQFTASDAEAEARFGCSVGLSENGLCLAVGSFLKDIYGNNDAGMVYIYQRNTIDSMWEEVTKLVADDGAANDYYGISVKMSGDSRVLAIGAHGSNTAAPNAGKVYLYKLAQMYVANIDETNVNNDFILDTYRYGKTQLFIDMEDSEIEIINELNDVYLDILDSSSSTGEYVDVDFETYKQFETLVITTNNTTKNSTAIDLIDVGTVVSNIVTSSDAQNSDGFGIDTSISDNKLVMVAGAFTEDTVASNAGKVYTYKRDTTDSPWVEINQLTASDGAQDDYYGYSLNITPNGLYLVISSPGANGGKVYTYKRATVSDEWTLVSTLTASNAQDDDRFGGGVSITNNGLVLIVGAYGEDSLATNAGKVYTYKRTSTDDDWSEVSQLTAENGQSNDYYGVGLSISNDGLYMLSASSHTSTNGTASGTVYEYSRATIDDAWSFVRKIYPNVPAAHDNFGQSTTLGRDGLMAIITAPGRNTGSVYIFVRANITDDWTEVKILERDATAAYFGSSCSISNDGMCCLIGEHNNNHVYEYNFINLKHRIHLDNHDLNTVPDITYITHGLDIIKSSSTNTEYTGYGYNDYKIKPGSDILLDGVVTTLTNASSSIGEESLHSVKYVNSIVDEIPDGYHIWTSNMDETGLTLVVGCSWDNCILTFNRSTLEEEFVLLNTTRSNDSGNNDYYGRGLAMSANGLVMVVGAMGNSSNDGKVYEYQRDDVNSVWSEVRQIVPSDSEIKFGASLSMSADGLILFVGSPSRSVDNIVNAGSVDTYKRDNVDSDWVFVNSLTEADPKKDNYIGGGVSITNDGLSCCVYSQIDVPYTNVGYMYTYHRPSIDSEWILISTLTNPTEMNQYDYFGTNNVISTDGLKLMIGAPYSNVRGINSGLVLLYERSTVLDSWTLVNEIISPNNGINTYFGAGVSFSKDSKVLIMSSANDITLYEYRIGNRYEYTLTYDYIDNVPEIATIPNRKQYIPETSLTYDMVNKKFISEYSTYTKTGRAVQRTILIPRKDTTVVEPFVSSLHYLT